MISQFNLNSAKTAFFYLTRNQRSGVFLRIKKNFIFLNYNTCFKSIRNLFAVKILNTYAVQSFFFKKKNYNIYSLHNINLLNNSDSLSYKKRFFTKIYFIGLGYKIYTNKNTLFIWIGLTHYTLFKFPKTIFIFPKKKRVYIVSYNENDYKNFMDLIFKIKKRDIYKGKGLLEVKSYKNFIKMKTAKKKQY